MSCDNKYRTCCEYADEEMYVYDQCCENCRYYCGWGEKRDRGCKLFSRDEYERFPKTHWCYQWKGERMQQSRKRGYDYSDDYSEGYGDCL